MVGGLVLAAALLVSAAACAPPRLLRSGFATCPDRLPVKILQDPACGPDAICGYSCTPGRWERTPPC